MKEKLVKVLLHERGMDVETPWAEDLGPAACAPGARRVRLANVPFLHSKPTYEDVIVVIPDADGRLAWDSEGVAFDDIGTRIEEDAGRWAMSVDYELRPGFTDLTAAFRALDAVGERSDLVVEGSFARRAWRAGRAYVAVPVALGVDAALQHLSTDALVLTLIHPIDTE
jgi:hypothetical protein